MSPDLAPGMSSSTYAGDAVVMFVAQSDDGYYEEIVMKLRRPKWGYSFVLFRADDYPTLHMVH